MIAVVFDFDGTMVDTYDTVIDAYNQLAPFFRISRIENRNILREYSFSEFIKEYRIASYKVFPLILTLRFLINQSKKGGSFTVLPDVKEILFKLREKGYSLGIVSTNSFSFIRTVLEREGIYQIFSFVKTSPFLSRKWRILKTLKERFDQVYYVGDEGRDVVAAKKAGVVSVAVTWGFNTEENLLRYNPNFIVRKPADILSIINL
ncbi:HAD-IA family hydrolase [Desulfurobacterium atlanticum]|uniref:Phosphoglycolate phosphatase n=1 Tax=Desulfurobacterium atlanticum TaxID=240169 RepID=A0A238Y712_9BACT|nr:HAD-IA family hydrolase [Desulfurobacterium atlanticum]SNR66897.1 phosphoglycolate phosphatase [Desulfurobacterium atlanticum]